MTHKLIWNTTKPAHEDRRRAPGEMRVMKGWWPSSIRGYAMNGRPIAKRDGKA